MKYRFAVIASFMLLFSCKEKNSAENDLRNAMLTHLYNGANNDSTNVKYYIEKVIYYDDNIKDKYICEFTVHVKAKLYDTTGIMKAYISKDFKKVDRYQ